MPIGPFWHDLDAPRRPVQMLRRLRVSAMSGLLRLAPVVLLLATALPAAARPARDLAAVSGVVFESQGDALTVRVHASSRVQAFSAERRGRTVTLTLMGAAVSSSMSRGRAALPVRDYRVEATGDRVVLTFDAPDCPDPQVTQEAGSADILLTFPDARRAAAGWGGGGWGARRAPDDRSAEPAPALAETPRPSPARVETPRVVPPAAQTPVETASRRPPTRRSRRTPQPASASDVKPPAPQPTDAPSATSASVWQSAPPAVVPYTPEATAVYVANGSNWRLDTIVLDAGHGGHDIGATYNGVREKDVTLGIVLALGPMLERELGVRVVYTRHDDHFEELRERGRIANRAGGKLFVSVHANAAGAASASGTETYFLAPHRSDSAHEVMERENSVIQMESAPSLYAEYTDQGDILQAMAMSAYQEESQTLARLVEGRLTSQGRRSRGVKQAGFLVLWAASMPAILVETGFVSNPDEARMLSSASGQQQTARAIFEAISAYRNQYERGLRLAAG